MTWSIQTKSASSRVMASPPQTYLALMSVTAMFLCSMSASGQRSSGNRRHILDNDVGNTANHAETLALDDTAGALSDQGLVGVDSDTEGTGVVAIPELAYERTMGLLARETY